MDLSKRVSSWSVEEVWYWAQEQYPSKLSTLQCAILTHAISGRALLRLKQHHLQRLGVEPEHQQEFLEDVLQLLVREELENLNDIISECFSGV